MCCLRLARAASNAGDRAKALETYQTIYYDWPTSEAADAAVIEMPISALGPVTAGTPRFARELARAERLFTDRRYAEAREAFEGLAAAAAGDDAEVVQLRMAESDYFLRRYSRVRDDLSPFLERAARRAEARFFYLMTTQRVGNRDQYIALTRALVDEFPDSSWAEEALNNLASFHIVNDEDDQADAVFREIVSRFPSGRYTARAMWKVGWRAYRQKQYAEAADVFERAAVAFPRTDYRPSYLYWAAKAREQIGDAAGADEALRLVVIDYANSYYGRLAAKALVAKGSAVPASGLVTRPQAEAVAAGEAVAPTADLIRWLIFLEMYDEALDEVRFAERAWGTSTALAATRAWLLNRTGELRPGHQPDAADVPAVPGGWRRVDAARGAVGHLSAAVLVAHQHACRRARPRSVPGRGVDRAGIDVRQRHRVVGEGHRIDADHADDRPPVGEAAWHPELLDAAADGGRRQRPDRHGVLRGPHEAVRERARRAGVLQRGREPRGALAA